MLVSTPYLNNTGDSSGLPRVISEKLKPSSVSPREPIRPRISGDLLVMFANERCWWPRRVTVRAGQLLVGNASFNDDTTARSFRLPLRQLSLAAGSLPNSLALYRKDSVILTLQTTNERSFELWVKTIAIELIRQTPLDAVRYLDILTLTECWNKKNVEEDWNLNYLKQNPHVNCHVCKIQCSSASGKLQNTNFQVLSDINSNIIEKTEETKTPDVASPNSVVPRDVKTVEVLLKKCQNSDNYVPVKEKLVLFESLCRLGRKELTNDDELLKLNPGAKRTHSMYDLSNCLNSTPCVKQICKYFENKTDDAETKLNAITKVNRRLIYSDSQLNSIRCNFNKSFVKVSCV